MRGYKAIGPDWRGVNGYKYKVGGRYRMKEPPEYCVRGFHFSQNLADCFGFYNLCRDVHIVEVEENGDLSFGEEGIATNDLVILRELSWEEVNRILKEEENEKK